MSHVYALLFNAICATTRHTGSALQPRKCPAAVMFQCLFCNTALEGQALLRLNMAARSCGNSPLQSRLPLSGRRYRAASCREGSMSFTKPLGLSVCTCSSRGTAAGEAKLQSGYMQSPAETNQQQSQRLNAKATAPAAEGRARRPQQQRQRQGRAHGGALTQCPASASSWYRVCPRSAAGWADPRLCRAIRKSHFGVCL